MARRRLRWRVDAGAAALVALLAGPAQGALLLEGTVGDFGDTFATRTVLPAGTDEVRGSLAFSCDPNPIFPSCFTEIDWFAFADLVPGSSYSISLLSWASTSSLSLYDSSRTELAFFSAGERFPTTVTGIVPGSGELVARPWTDIDSGAYQIWLTAERVVVPEPSTMLLVGAALAALSASSRSQRGQLEERGRSRPGPAALRLSMVLRRRA